MKFSYIILCLSSASKQVEKAGYQMASKIRDFLPKGLRVRAALYVNLRASAGIEV